MRMIDADELRKEWLENGKNENIYSTNDFLCVIDDTPTVEANQWISVNDKLPENETNVLLCVERRLVNGKKTRLVTEAFYTDGNHRTDDSDYDWEEIDCAYDEENDAFIVPEGWWSISDYVEQFNAVDDFPVCWMHLPKPPEIDGKDGTQK